MNWSEKKSPRIKFAHIFIAAAVLVVLVNFAIGGFAPYFMLLIPGFPFLLLSVLPISWKPYGHSDTHGLIGAGIGALVSVIPGTALFAYDMITGWKGGADIGLGLLYMFLPVYSAVFMGVGYFMGAVVARVRRRDFKGLPDIFRTVFLFIGSGFCFYFLLDAHGEYNLWRYYEKSDPSAAELYEIGFWISIIKAVASLFIPLVIYLIARKNKKRSK